MKLQTAIHETILRDAEVVAGRRNLGRDITWVHMVDHPQIVQWVEAGELLLTTGYNWPRDEQESRALVIALNDLGLAGVVLAVPQFRDHFPKEAIIEADRVGLPLLELPWDIAFSEVTRDILAKIINFQGEIIARSERLHRALTNAAVTATSLSDLAGALFGLLRRTVTFTDRAGHILGSSEGSGATKEVERDFVAVMEREHATVDRLQSAQHPVVIDFGTVGTPLQRASLAVRLQETIVALIWLDLDEDGLQELDSRALEHASIVAALHLMHQRQLSQQEDRLGYALVASLLDGQFSASTGALERAQVRGWSESQPYYVCLILLDEPIPLTADGFSRREYWVDALKRQLRARGLPELIAMSSNQIRFVIPAEVSPRSIWETFEASRASRAAMAISRPQTGIKGMVAAAQDVAALVPRLRPGRVHDFEEILFPRALMGDADAREMLVQRLVSPLADQRRGEFLLETLCRLADEGFQLGNTAKALGIHISTLRYRLERIESILNVSLEDPRTRFQLQVAVAIYRLREE